MQWHEQANPPNPQKTANSFGKPSQIQRKYLTSPLTSIEAGALADREANDEVVDLVCLVI